MNRIMVHRVFSDGGKHSAVIDEQYGTLHAQKENKMTVKMSIECWILSSDQTQVLLLTVPEKPGKRPSFNQPVTGGIEEGETPQVACVRELMEETGRRVSVNDLKKVHDQFVVKIGKTLTIHKTLFLLKTDFFTPALSPREHSGFSWIAKDSVEKELFYQSNKDTWALVNAHLA